MSFIEQLSLSTRFSQLPHAFYSDVSPQPLESINWLIWNGTLATQLRFPSSADNSMLEWLSGAKVPDQFSPLAMKYAGHQFGAYNPDLGDGRGLLLCELNDENNQVYDLHLKGAGRTPYSRMGDGRAVLRSTIREYLCSEAMAGLNIPTTRALGIIDSETPVYRESQETGALLLRVAKTHIRFGHFEHFFYTNQLTELTLLADKVIEWYWPEYQSEDNRYLAMFSGIVTKTAEMIAHWQASGFAHGVMNTDNMSILGETFDYGPFAFMDDYQPSLICNHSDYQGRYAFNQQPRIGLWNLSALAHSLSPLIGRSDLESELEKYEVVLNKKFSQLMRSKLGLLSHQEGDSQLFASMFELLHQQRIDYVTFFRQLSNIDSAGIEPIILLFLDQNPAKEWLAMYTERCEQETIPLSARCAEMRNVNPKFILRNYLAQQAIEKAQQGDYSEVHRLIEVLRFPFSEQPENEHYAALPPDWGKAMEISCSS